MVGGTFSERGGSCIGLGEARKGTKAPRLEAVGHGQGAVDTVLESWKAPSIVRSTELKGP